MLKEDEEFRYAVAGLIGLDEILKRLDRNEKELIKLRKDMLKGFELMRRHLDALGARWGLMSEEAFREGLRGLLEEELGLKVEKWTYRDEEGMVYGYPSIIDIDVAIHDGKVVLDWSHGMGYVIEEVFIPERCIIFNLADGELHVFKGEREKTFKCG